MAILGVVAFFGTVAVLIYANLTHAPGLGY